MDPARQAGRRRLACHVPLRHIDTFNVIKLIYLNVMGKANVGIPPLGLLRWTRHSRACSRPDRTQGIQRPADAARGWPHAGAFHHLDHASPALGPSQPPPYRRRFGERPACLPCCLEITLAAPSRAMLRAAPEFGAPMETLEPAGAPPPWGNSPGRIFRPLAPLSAIEAPAAHQCPAFPQAPVRDRHTATGPLPGPKSARSMAGMASARPSLRLAESSLARLGTPIGRAGRMAPFIPGAIAFPAAGLLTGWGCPA